eukprot:11192167-Alexandrium_andersonii.AAC.1
MPLNPQEQRRAERAHAYFVALHPDLSPRALANTAARACQAEHEFLVFTAMERNVPPRMVPRTIDRWGGDVPRGRHL